MMRMAGFGLVLVVLSVCAGSSDVLGQTPAVRPVLINEFLAVNKWTTADPCTAGWIELFNPGRIAVNVAGMYLTDDLSDPRKWQIPTTGTTSIAARGYLVVWVDGDAKSTGLHATFSLKSEGEEIGLFASDGSTLMDSVVFNRQMGDISFGRFPDGSDQWRYSGAPTRGLANDHFYEDVAQEVEFSQERGFRQSPFQLWFRTQTSGASIYYTLNGSNPIGLNGQPTGTLYTGPITISHTTCVCAAAHVQGWMPSPTRTATYIFLDEVIKQSKSPAGFPASWRSSTADYEMDPDVVNAAAYQDRIKDDLQSVPSVVLSMSNDDFFDYDKGIYANSGNSGDAWEKAASIEWIDPAKQSTFQVNAGLRMQGAAGVTNSLKRSFRIAFRAAYGPSELEYPVFEEGEVQCYDGLVLRSIWNYSWIGDSGGRNERGDYLRDLFAKNTMRDMGDLACRGRPVHLYLNGLYWGMYILAERPDAGFAAIHVGGDKEDYDIVHASGGSPSSRGTIRCGTPCSPSRQRI